MKLMMMMMMKTFSIADVKTNLLTMCKNLLSERKEEDFFLFLFKVHIFDISIDYGAFDIQHSIILSQKEYLLYLEKDVVRDKNMYFIALEPEIG